MPLPPDEFLDAPPSALENADLPVDYEATYREGGDGTFVDDPLELEHDERVAGGGEADVEWGEDAAEEEILLATLRRTRVYGAVLLDSFLGAPPLPELSEVEGLFFGESGGDVLYQFGEDWQDDLEDITARILTVPIAPGGVGGEVLFHNLYLSLEWQSRATVTVTPILDGRRVTTLQRTLELDVEAEPRRERYEIPLAEPYEVGGIEELRTALRGTWFQVQVEVTQESPSETGVVVEGVELEQEVVRESHPGVGYVVESLEAVATERPALWFLGVGGAIFEGDVGADDDGTPITARIETAHVAFGGTGGEVVFHNLYLAVTRANASDVDLTVTPLVDGEAQEVETVTLEGVADPVTEVHEVPVMQAHSPEGTELLRHAPRGTWFAARIETEAPGDTVILEGMSVERELVRESEEPAGA